MVGIRESEANPSRTDYEEYSYFTAVCFPASQLAILDYNRVVKGLDGMSSEEFLKALKESFDVTEESTRSCRPQQLYESFLYFDGKQYNLKAKQGAYDDNDPIGVLDVDIFSRLILDELLRIKGLRSDKCIDFVGSLRGLEELERQADSGGVKMALVFYPVSIRQITDIANSGKIISPKTT